MINIIQRYFLLMFSMPGGCLCGYKDGTVKDLQLIETWKFYFYVA